MTIATIILSTDNFLNQEFSYVRRENKTTIRYSPKKADINIDMFT